MNIDPGWERRIVAYLYKFQWFTPEAVMFERRKGTKVLEGANPYTFEMCVRRAQAGADVPGWLVMHVEGEMRLRGAA